MATVRGIRFLPNAITVLSFSTGLTSVLFASQGQWMLAMWMISPLSPCSISGRSDGENHRAIFHANDDFALVGTPLITSPSNRYTHLLRHSRALFKIPPPTLSLLLFVVAVVIVAVIVDVDVLSVVDVDM